MCGIAGVARFAGNPRQMSAVVNEMADEILHRGPDAGAVWIDAEIGVGLGHRRLSILDLSPAGQQPMQSACARFVVVYNGEIYNWAELRGELEAAGQVPAWRGHSDTEVLLAGISVWGLEATLRRARGMFALALWDRAEKTLTLARDRIGEKPLYYGWSGDAFLFGSELKALCAFPGWRGEVDRSALASYMRYGYVPLPHSIYRGIRKLIPGTFITLEAGSVVGTWPEPQVFWSARCVAEQGEISGLADVEAVDQLESLLSQAVARQMIADVPLGAFLSGGIDSSMVVALMQAQSSQPVRTFSIGFSETDYDEAIHARAVATHLGTEHTELYVASADALDVIPRLPSIYDEPFGDSSQIPTYLVAAMARQHVTVSLSGDGGDELFGGYNRYLLGRDIWRQAARLPDVARCAAEYMITRLSPSAWDKFGRCLPLRWRQPALGDRLHKLARVINVTTPDEFYRRLVSQQREKQSLVIGASALSTWADEEAAGFSSSLRGGNFVEKMMFNDLVAYLTDDIMVKVDRAAMAVSLETRMPLLDHRVVEFAWSLPMTMKIRDGRGKWLLRQVLNRYVPAKLIERPKQGFGVPLDSWLRGPLREWAEALLDEARLKREGYLHPGMVREKWAEHLSGQRNWQDWLWNVLMFQAWLGRWCAE